MKETKTTEHNRTDVFTIITLFEKETIKKKERKEAKITSLLEQELNWRNREQHKNMNIVYC